MQLYDKVGINCENGTTTVYQGADVKCIGYGVYVDDYVCVLAKRCMSMIMCVLSDLT